MIFKAMKILITGATGYLGGALIKDLIQKKYSIFAIVRNAHNDKYKLHAKVNYIHLDLKNKNNLIMKLKIINPEIIIHLAALIPKNKKDNYNKSYKENRVVTRNLLEGSATLKSLKKFIFASTISVFSNLNTNNIRYDENNTPNPIDHYGLHKLKAEKEIAIWAKKYNKQAVILRFSGIHGFPRASGVIYNYYLSAIKNNYINVENPEYYFSFLFLEDAKNACIAALHEKDKEEIVSTYHIAGSQIISLSELAFKIKSILGIDMKIQLNKKINKNFSILTNEKAVKSLKWIPKKFDARLEENIKNWNIKNNLFIN